MKAVSRKAMNSMLHPARVFALRCIYLGALCLAMPTGAADTAPQPRTLEHNGANRTYYIALPANFDTETTYWPLVMVHGGGGNAAENRYAAAMRRLADEQGLPAIVIQPQFITEDKQVSRFPSLGEGAFLLAVLEKVRAEFKLHEKILLNGYSMGGQFTHRFALAHPDLVQACAPFAAGTWTTPDGTLLIEEYGTVENPEAFLSTPENAAKIPERLHDLFDPRVATAAGLKAAPGAEQVPFLVMCGTLDTRFTIAKDFAASLQASGFSVETEWPETPHTPGDGDYAAEFEKYSAHAIQFFKRHTGGAHAGLRDAGGTPMGVEKWVSLKYHLVMKTELVTTLKRHATRLLADLRESSEPVLITEHGRPAAYLVDVDAYEFLQQRLAILEGIARGERAVLEGRTYSQAEARDKMKKWLA